MKVRVNKKYAVISVSAGTGCYRHIKVPMNKKLSWLADTILDIFEFDHDHLYAFFMNNRIWDDSDAYYYQPDDNYTRDVEEYKISEAGVTDKKQFKFLFDFGDEWVFQCKVLRIENDGKDGAELLKSVGEPPEQYPSYDEWDEDDEDYDDEDDEYNEEDLYSDFMYSSVSDSLYQSAIEFSKAKGSRKTYFHDLIAVKLSNGEIGYITYDEGNEIPAIYFSIGTEGFTMYDAILHYFEDNVRINEALLDDCTTLYTCGFHKKEDLDKATFDAVKSKAVFRGYTSIRKFPIFSQREPMYAPKTFENEEDSDLFEEAIKVLTFVFKNFSKYKNAVQDWPQFGKLLCVIPDGENFTTEQIDMPNRVLEAVRSPKVKANKLPKAGKWACEITTSRDYGFSDYDSEPHLFYALALIRLDKKGSVNSVFDLDMEYKDIVKFINDEFIKLGYYPEEIQVRTGFTGVLLDSFCKSAGISMVDNKNIPELDEALDSDECNPGPDEEFDEDTDPYVVRQYYEEHNPEFAGMMGMAEGMIMEMSVDELKAMKKEHYEFWQCIKEMYENNIFAPDVMAKLKKVFG